MKKFKYEVGSRIVIHIQEAKSIVTGIESETIDETAYYKVGPDAQERTHWISETELENIAEYGTLYLPDQDPKEDEDLVEISEIVEGTTVEVGVIRMEILDISYRAAGEYESGVLCLAKDILFNKAFDEDNCNDWRSSTLRQYLNGEFKRFLLEKIGGNALLPFERDLLSDDGLTDYCDDGCVDYVSLISCDEYRMYREHISNKSGSWWTLTPYSCSVSDSSSTRAVFTDGTLSSGSACIGGYGVAPIFLLSKDLMVKEVKK